MSLKARIFLTRPTVGVVDALPQRFVGVAQLLLHGDMRSLRHLVLRREALDDASLHSGVCVMASNSVTPRRGSPRRRPAGSGRDGDEHLGLGRPLGHAPQRRPTWPRSTQIAAPSKSATLTWRRYSHRAVAEQVPCDELSPVAWPRADAALGLLEGRGKAAVRPSAEDRRPRSRSPAGMVSTSVRVRVLIPSIVAVTRRRSASSLVIVPV